MAVLAFALYALAVEGHAGADDARAALAGLRARYGDDCDVRSVWDECLQWSFGPDPTDGWWRMERMRLYCLVAGYYLGLLEGGGTRPIPGADAVPSVWFRRRTAQQSIPATRIRHAGRPRHPGCSGL